MIKWFMNLTATNQIAIVVAGITAIGGIIVAIVNGIFNNLFQKKDNKISKYSVNQTSYDKSMQIGVQINKYKEDE